MSPGALRFWGIDGCKGGWFCFGLAANIEAANAHWRAFTAPSMPTAWDAIQPHAPHLVLTDMPLGLPTGAAERTCDRLARRFVGARKSSIFPMPCRQAVALYARAAPPRCAASKRQLLLDAAACHRRHTGKGLSAQTRNLIPAIADMEAFRRAAPHAPLREMHPEVAFAALNAQRGLAHYKKTPLGERERLALLRRHVPSLPRIWRQLTALYPRRAVAPDDVLDAMVGALTAWLTQRHRLQRLSEAQAGEPAMEIVFVAPPWQTQTQAQTQTQKQAQAKK